MGKTIRSARGEIINLDLLQIKEQIAAAPAPIDVQRRSDFIERKMRRRLKKNTTVETTDMIDVEPSFSGPGDLDEVEEQVEAVVDTPVVSEALQVLEEPKVESESKRTTKQRARRE